MRRNILEAMRDVFNSIKDVWLEVIDGNFGYC